MKFQLITICFILMLSCTAKRVDFIQHEEVKLSTPQVSVEDVFFRKETVLSWGSQPEGISLNIISNQEIIANSELLPKQELLVKKSTKLRFQSVGDIYSPSEFTDIQVYKVKDRSVEVESLSLRTEPYNTAEVYVLIDQQKAAKQFTDPGWLGFKQDSVVVELSLGAKSLEGIVLSFLQDQKSWIFAPTSMRIEAFDKTGSLLHKSSENYGAELQREGASFQFLESSFKEINPSSLRITIFPMPSIPTWHPGSGNEPWLFIDEIVLL